MVLKVSANIMQHTSPTLANHDSFIVVVKGKIGRFVARNHKQLCYYNSNLVEDLGRNTIQKKNEEAMAPRCNQQINAVIVKCVYDLH